jgi:putative FmdB family regulatory protein
MPIYEYRCSSCGREHEALQKLSEPALTVCPACGRPTLVKLVSAAGFQLKGSGWYATDFRNAGSKKPAKSDAAGNGKSAEGSTTTDSGSKSGGSSSDSGSKSGGSSSDSGSQSGGGSGGSGSSGKSAASAARCAPGCGCH